jgi:hypothetical protein
LFLSSRSKYLQAAAFAGTPGPIFPVNILNFAHDDRARVVPTTSPLALRFCFQSP